MPQVRGLVGLTSGAGSVTGAAVQTAQGPNAMSSLMIANRGSEEDQKVYTWISELISGGGRETALLELSKKREQVEDLALILWHSFGMCGLITDNTLCLLQTSAFCWNMNITSSC